MAKPNVKFTRQEVSDLRDAYELIQDCLEGGRKVKQRGEIYLPRPNPSDTSAENVQRYRDYIVRAVFYNVTRRTVEGLVGTVFSRRPILDLPSDLEIMREDADGAGVGLEQVATKALALVAAYGRAGVLTDYPTVNEVASRAAVLEGEIRPTVTIYEPLNIINWREITVGGKRKKSLVVLAESRTKELNEFEFEVEPQFRVLRLNESGEYEVEVFAGEDLESQGIVVPLDSTGQPFKEIPFDFIGSENNDPSPDSPPAYDLAALNIAHYRNSADYEESVYIVGQPTPYFAGLTAEWVNEVMQGTVYLGSRAVIPLPEGGSAGMLQAAPNPMPLEAMRHKEEQMVALGARLVQAKAGQRTATEASADEANSKSALSKMADNVSTAFTRALKFACQYVGAEETAVDFKLNTEFDLSNLTSEDVKALIEIWQKNAIVTSEMRDKLIKAGYATLDYKKYQEERDADVQYALENMPELQPDPNAAPANENEPD